MSAFLGIIIFVFGTIIGSFLNVLVLRYKTGRSVGGRSACLSCGTTLRASELVPIASYIFCLGRCRSCKSRISWQYPAVELATGVVFLLVFLHALQSSAGTLASLIFFWFAFSILIAISAYDALHKIVPDEFAFVFGFASLVWLLLSHDIGYFTTLSGILDLLSGPVFFTFFFALWYVSDGAWIGLGDGKLSLGIGWMLGFAEGISALVLGFWVAAAVSLLLIALQRIFLKKLPRLSGKTEIPFAPFFAFGALLAYLFSPDLFSIHALMLGV